MKKADETLHTSSDEQLLAAYCKGDLSAFQALYQRHKGGLYRYFLRQCPQQSLAEDLFQDTWSQVIDKAVSFRRQSQFNTWLYRIAHNKLVDHVRHLKRVNDKQLWQHQQAELMPEHTADTLLQQQRTQRVLYHCLQKLPQAQKDSFLLKEEANLSSAQIAEVLGASLEACKSRLRYAYQALKSCVQLKLGQEVA